MPLTTPQQRGWRVSGDGSAIEHSRENFVSTGCSPPPPQGTQKTTNENTITLTVCPSNWKLLKLHRFGEGRPVDIPLYHVCVCGSATAAAAAQRSQHSHAAHSTKAKAKTKKLDVPRHWRLGNGWNSWHVRHHHQWDYAHQDRTPLGKRKEQPSVATRCCVYTLVPRTGRVYSRHTRWLSNVKSCCA